MNSKSSANYRKIVVQSLEIGFYIQIEPKKNL